MIPGLQNATQIPELRKRALYSLFMLIIYRIGIFVPLPGINLELFRQRFIDTERKEIFGLINMFSGGAIENFSILALGIMPYISVSIIMQLLTSTSKYLEELSKEGQHGKRIITKYTRIGTVILALVQGGFISFGLQQQGLALDPSYLFVIKSAITLAAGTAFVMWLGEQITERGIGNGTSLIIAAGIIARMPSTLLTMLDDAGSGGIELSSLFFVLLFAVATVLFIVFVERCQRKIPVQYPKRVVGGRMMTQSASQHMPLKLNTAGVIPPIFASTFLVFPLTIAQFAVSDKTPNAKRIVDSILEYVVPGSFTYELAFAVLILFFGYFYTALMFDPAQISDNLKKNGGFIPTVRPGADTTAFLMKVLNRLTLWGSLYLAIICIAPQVFYIEMDASAFASFFGGTAVLIVVGVTMDTMSQIQSHLFSKSYEAFLEKGPQKVRGSASASQVGGRIIRR